MRALKRYNAKPYCGHGCRDRLSQTRLHIQKCWINKWCIAQNMQTKVLVTYEYANTITVRNDITFLLFKKKILNQVHTYLKQIIRVS